MTSILLYDKVLVPISYIKAPGALFSPKKPHSEPLIDQKRIQGLLGDFKSKTISSRDSLTSIAISQIIEKSSESEIESFMRSHSYGSSMNPGKLKRETAEISSVLFKATEILSIYDVDLVLDNCKEIREAFNLLKVIVPEICFFPADFFRKIQLKQLIICGRTVKRTGIESSRFSVELRADSNKTRQRLFQIIWNHLVKANPDIVSRLNETAIRENIQISADTFYSLEDVFIGLMNNTNHALMKPLMKKMREMLMNYYPEAMSEEQFKSRNKEMKRMFRVRFDF